MPWRKDLVLIPRSGGWVRDRPEPDLSALTPVDANCVAGVARRRWLMG